MRGSDPGRYSLSTPGLTAIPGNHVLDDEAPPGVARVQPFQVRERNEVDELGVLRDALRGARTDYRAVPALQAHVPEDVQSSSAFVICDGTFEAQVSSAADNIRPRL